MHHRYSVLFFSTGNFFFEIIKLIFKLQGNKQSLKQSGMVPTFTEKKDFGKVPTYIKKLKKSKLEDEKRWEHEQQEIIRRREMMKLQDQERDAILQVKFDL